MNGLAEEVVAMLRERGLTLGTVESATGGLIAHLITGVAGSSECFLGSIVSYSNGIKTGLVGVGEATIEGHGAVSGEVAEEMAAGGRKVLGVSICVSDTGIAGPSGATAGKPVGLFWLGLSHATATSSRRHVFDGDRQENRSLAATAALEWVREYLTELV
jgi:PncC family amidohydrolase